MPKYKFIGEDSRVFPTLSKELKKGDIFHSEVKIIASFLEEVKDEEKVTVKFDADKADKSKKAKSEEETKDSATSADDK